MNINDIVFFSASIQRVCKNEPTVVRFLKKALHFLCILIRKN